MNKPNAKYDHVYAIIRFDKFQTEIEYAITVTKVVWSEELAKQEVARLSSLNGDKASRYFYQITRIAKPFTEIRMKTLNLIMLRHGMTDHNSGLRLTGWGDPELNETGHSQAVEAAANLSKEFEIEAIFASPLTRTVQTASYLAKATELPVKYDAGLKELNFGEMEGYSIRELIEKHPEMYKAWRGADDPHFGWPGGETRLAFHTRVDQAIWRVIAESIEHKFETVAIVAHGGALAGFVSEIITGIPYKWREYLLENCQYYVVAVDYDETKPIDKETVGLRVVSMGKTVPIGPNN